MVMAKDVRAHPLETTNQQKSRSESENFPPQVHILKVNDICSKLRGKSIQSLSRCGIHPLETTSVS